ncbi:MAG: sulfite exporter TauE/SafE family protein [Winogradskyella sp.]|uniref:urease accessory protein UreH domain-containing protein n=1 Tax=Winogradskyella sp. TaxID=1883156 RepID=UPI0025EA47C9|nr:sulfite exporter TauE/SafE family protein [Winogradskyella sp.]NRB59437.1 sulfite exporter TauE/SafE family protein [Winogradskyella sp.]
MLSFPLIAGIIASILHVLSGPDHLAAVTPIAIESKFKVWRIGFFWGAGHLLGMLIIGLLFFMFKDIIPVEAISGYSEQLVAVVLIGIGLWSLYKLFFKEKIHSRPHIHSDGEVYVHTHNHIHSDTKHKSNYGNNEKKSSFSIGVLHGLAGVAHFLLLLPALGFETRFESVQYIGGFAIGTLMAMTLYTHILGLVTKTSSNNKALLNTIRVAGGFFALIIGVYWMFLTL